MQVLIATNTIDAPSNAIVIDLRRRQISRGGVVPRYSWPMSFRAVTLLIARRGAWVSHTELADFASEDCEDGGVSDYHSFASSVALHCRKRLPRINLTVDTQYTFGYKVRDTANQ